MIATIESILNNVFKASDYKDKDTGVISEGKYKAQLLIENQLSSGQTKNELLDVTISDIKAGELKSMIGQKISLKCNISSKDKLFISVI